MNDSLLSQLEIVSYDPRWPLLYLQEVERIQATWRECHRFHHVGSTAVPGLAAKPKIDMLGVVSDLDFDGSTLESLGYQDRGGFNLPSRRSFTLRTDVLQVNLHVFETGDPEIEGNLLFRDALRQNADTREAYAELKEKILCDEMAHQKASTTAFYRGYTLQKQDFIHDILRQAGFQRERWVLCSHENEWNAAKRYYAIAFPEQDCTQIHPKDPDRHSHLLLYRGVDRIGYLYVRLSKGLATIHPLLGEPIDPTSEKYHVLMRPIYRWLLRKGFDVMDLSS